MHPIGLSSQLTSSVSPPAAALKLPDMHPMSVMHSWICLGLRLAGLLDAYICMQSCITYYLHTPIVSLLSKFWCELSARRVTTSATRCVEVPIFLSQFFQQNQNLQSEPGESLT